MWQRSLQIACRCASYYKFSRSDVLFLSRRSHEAAVWLQEELAEARVLISQLRGQLSATQNNRVQQPEVSS